VSELSSSTTRPVNNQCYIIIIIQENYGSVLRDCSKAIELNPKSSKAYYRSALALVALERFDEAINCCLCCLQFDSKNKSVETVLLKAEKLQRENDKKEQQKQERIRKENEAKMRLDKAFQVGMNSSLRCLICVPLTLACLCI